MATSPVTVPAVVGSANVALYWGQGPAQTGLAHYCDQSTVDIIPIGFINRFPNQANGLVAENFGNQCWNGNYTGPGYDNQVNPADDFLYKQCPQLQEDLYYCQTKTNKKMVLSIGGGVAGYELNDWDDGVALAEFLWGAYGPYTEEWVAGGGVRPLDLGYYNNDTTKRIDIDGFDFDIEFLGPDLQQGYIGCITTLRQKFLLNPSKTYLITGAPQCPLPENNMGLAIAQVKFDALFIQFYNNDAYGCSARNWTNKNTNYATTKVEKASGFNYNAWTSVLATGASRHAKLFIGLPGGILPTGQAAATVGDILTVAETANLISAYAGAPNFGGVMIWEATYAEANKNVAGLTYYQSVKKALLAAASAPASSSSISTVSSTVYPTSKPSTISSTSHTSSTPSTSSVSSTSTSSTPAATPTTVPSVGACTYMGCYTEATGNNRALSGASYAGTADFAQMTVEYCASKCTGFTYFGLEYSGECYCGDEFNAGSVKTDATLCTNFDYKCNGAPGEFCGGYAVLDAYQCGSPSVSSSSSVVISSTSSSTLSSSIPSSATSSSTSVSSTSTISSSASTTTSSSKLSSSSSSTSSLTSSYPSSSSSSSYSSSSSSHSLSSSSYSSTTELSTNTKTTGSSTTPSTTASISSSLSYSSLGLYTNTSSSHSVSTSTKSPSGTLKPSYPVSTTKLTTSTVYTTSVYTVTSCAATVTDCPSRIGQVTTETISLYTTICPVTEAQGTATATPTASPYSEIPGYTVSTIYTTTVYTVTSCAATVTDCPARIGSVTTDIISLYTTYCPASGSSPASTSIPAYPFGYPSYPAGSDETSTTTIFSTFTTYRTVTVSLSTATVLPVVYSTALVVPVESSVAPYPTGAATGAKAGTTGTGSPVVSPTPLVTYVGSGAGKNVAGSFVVALGALVILL